MIKVGWKQLRLLFATKWEMREAMNDCQGESKIFFANRYLQECEQVKWLKIVLRDARFNND